MNKSKTKRGVYNKVLLLSIVFIFPSLTCFGSSEDLPHWVIHPPGDSTSFIRVLGSKTNAPSFEEARAGAFDNALVQIAKRIMAQVDVKRGPVRLALLQSIRGAKIKPGAEYHRKDRRGHSVWLLMQYPWEEYNREIESRKRPLELWVEAEKKFNEVSRAVDPEEKLRLTKSGKNLLLKIVAEYPVGGQNYFESEHALFRLAENELSVDNLCAAKDFYWRVRDHSKQASWKTKATEQWNKIEVEEADWTKYILRKVFAGKVVGLACVQEIDGKISPSKNLYAEMAKQIQSAGSVVKDVTSQVSFQGLLEASRATALPVSLTKIVSPVDLAVIVSIQGKGIEKEHPRLPPGKKVYVFSGEVNALVAARKSIVFRDKFPVKASSSHGKDVCLYTLAVQSKNVWTKHFVKSGGGAL